MHLPRKHLQKLADMRVDDAQVLLQNRRWSAAHYLAGYAVELGLKACIAQQFIKDAIPDKAMVDKTYSHDLEKLLGVAGLKEAHKEAKRTDPDFQANWTIISQWGPEGRYDITDQFSAVTMVRAVSDQESGVLSWIRQHW